MAYSMIRSRPLRNKQNLSPTPHSQRKVCKTVFEGPAVSGFQEHSIAEQLSQEMRSIKNVLKRCKEELNQRAKKSNTTRAQLIGMEREVTKKKNEIKAINLEIAGLKENRLGGKPQVQEKFKLARQIADMKTQLSQRLQAYQGKMTKYGLLCEAVSQLEEKWAEVHPNHTINYQIYRIHRKDQTTYDLIKESKINQEKDSLNTTPSANSSLQQLQSKKNKLNAALAASRKKHKLTILELNDKLQFLRDEDYLISKDLETIVTQKQELESKVRSRFGHRTRKVQKSTLSPSRPHYFDN